MFDPSRALSAFRIPSDILIALDNRPLHFALQPYHFVIRALHVLTMAAFLGGIALLDLRLMGAKAAAPLSGFAQRTIPWLYVTFGITVVTGVALFLYDPLHVGSHAYFTLKLLFMALGLVNALAFHRWALADALRAETSPPRKARIGAAISLCLWTLVVVAASLNVEGPPKVLLTGDGE
jgi:hypothetical protein